MVQQNAAVIQRILAAFPHRKASELELTSPNTPIYNCIAYAAGDHKRIWWPDAAGNGYWPPQIQRAVTLTVFRQAFEQLNYKGVKTHIFEIGIENIAIFAKGGQPTNSALQLINGKWSSKFGKEVDISHQLFPSNGHTYGNVGLIMARLRVRIK